MGTLELIKRIKIDLSKGVIDSDSTYCGSCEFEISPKDFLNFSKQDFKTDDRRGDINALTNAKRAIDCQTDKIFFSLGIDPANFPREIIQNYISKSRYPPQKGISIKLQLLQAIQFAPATLVSEVRDLRHDVEHYYRIPTKERVRDSIELAELFIQATDYKLEHTTGFYFSDDAKINRDDIRLINCIDINYSEEKKGFAINGNIDAKERFDFDVNHSLEEFFYILKVASSFDYEEDLQDALKDWFRFIGHPMPRSNISFEVL